MNNRKLSFLLPFRCVIFVLIFAIGSLFTGKALADLSSIWSVVAQILATSAIPGFYEMMCAGL